MLDAEQVVSAINKATNGTFHCPGGGESTCMGWIPRFDENGNQVNYDPNYHHSHIILGNESFGVTVQGRHVWIWREDEGVSSYMWAMSPENYASKLVAELNI